MLEQQRHPGVQVRLICLQPEEPVAPFCLIVWQMSLCANKASSMTIWPFIQVQAPLYEITPGYGLGGKAN